MPRSSDYVTQDSYVLPKDGAAVGPRLWVQAAEDGAAEIEARLRRMLVLSEIAAEDGAADRAGLQRELERLRREIDRIADEVDRRPVFPTGRRFFSRQYRPHRAGGPVVSE